MRKNSYSLGVVEVPRQAVGVLKPSAPEHFSIGSDLIPREMINRLRHLEERRRPPRTMPASGSTISAIG